MNSRSWLVMLAVAAGLACQPSPSCPFLVSHLDVQGLWAGLTDGGTYSVLTTAETAFLNRTQFLQPLPENPVLQVGLNGECFVGLDAGFGAGFGLSLQAFIEDATDVQCRPGLNSLSASGNQVGGSCLSSPPY
ncbi:MAG: hypothetical protein ACYDCL_09945 [Myxococcales bacterium]